MNEYIQEKNDFYKLIQEGNNYLKIISYPLSGGVIPTIETIKPFIENFKEFYMLQMNQAFELGKIEGVKYKQKNSICDLDTNYNDYSLR